MNKKISINDLKDVSECWINKNKKYSDDDIFYISPNIILQNLFYNKMIGLIDIINKQEDCHYTSIYQDLIKNGWDRNYPARIGIGDRGEIFIHGGNHRINLIKNLNLEKIPFKFVYVKNYSPLIQTHLENGKEFYPYGLLPKWSKK